MGRQQQTGMNGELWSGGIPPAVFQHPEDRAALEKLEAVPLFPELTRKVMELGYDRMSHGLNMATKVRLSARQLPHLYRVLPPLCRALAIPEPEFYLELDPSPNAYAMGDAVTSITITSGLVECMDEDEFRAIVAHECGHIACRHMKYLTMCHLLRQLYGADRIQLSLLGVTFQPVIMAQFYWMRRAELSCDRAAAAALGGARPVVEAMLRLAGGPKVVTGLINVEAYMQQADAYEKLIFSDWDNTLQSVAIMYEDHPFCSVRAKQVTEWTKTPEFQRAVEMVSRYASEGPQCGTCGQLLPEEGRFCGFCGTAVEKP